MESRPAVFGEPHLSRMETKALLAIYWAKPGSLVALLA